MHKLKVLTDPNPILRETAQPVSSFNGEIQELIDNMVYTMRHSEGVGLAAPQVGESIKIVVAEYDVEKDDESFPLTVLINPKIKSLSENQVFMAEGCLSFPGKETFIKRPDKVEIEALDRWGKKVSLLADKLQARVILHEIDHLNGILMIDHIKTVSTIFVGKGSLGVPSLERIINDPQFKLKTVVTGIDKRGHKGVIEPTIIAKIADKLKLKILKTDDILKIKKQIIGFDPELMILADFNQIIPENIIGIPKYGILNIHPSLLPKYRGPSPVVSAILAGEKKTGVSIIKIDKNVDSGEILSQIEVKIRNNETANKLKERLALHAGLLLVETIPYYLAGEITPIVQDKKDATYTKIFTKKDGQLKGDESSSEVHRMVRAFTPWPGVYQIINNRKIFITKTHQNKNGDLVIERVKPEGKRDMKYEDFIRGNSERLTFEK